MISFIRRALSSWIVLGLFGLILVSFVVTGVFTDGTGGLGQLAGRGETIAQIGRYRLTVADAQQRVQAQFEAAREQNPGLDMAAFVRSGAVDQLLEQVINGLTMEELARRSGMAVSKRLIDAEIDQIAAFKGPTGKFDPNLFTAALQQRKITEDMLRDDIGNVKTVEMMATPIAGGSRPPAGVVLPYAALRLEQRRGQLLFVPANAGGPAPTDQQLAQFYQRNTQRYIVPETRVIRYATFDRSRFATLAAPTEAELAAEYKGRAAEFAARERRTFSQVIVPAQANAGRVAAAAKGGAALPVAARAGGGEATTLAPQEQAAFAALSSPAIAQAAFAAAQGGVVGPVRSPLGWHVIKVEKIERIGGKTLADVRAELAGTVTRRKQDAAIADFVTEIEDAVGDGATFDEVVARHKLSVTTLPPVTASGIAPNEPSFKPGAALAPILKDNFLASLDDDPAVQTIAPGQLYAFSKVDRVIPSAPRPLNVIRAQVAADFVADRALRAARRIADEVAAKVSRGTPIAAAAAGTGSIRPLSAKRLDLELSDERVPPELALLFAMAPKSAKVLSAPDKSGWNVVWLDTVVPGNAASDPALLQRTQAELGQVSGEEYVKQFAAAIRADLGVEINKDAVAALKRSLTGSSSQ